MSNPNVAPSVAASVAGRPYFPTQEPQMAQRDQDLIDKARGFCMVWVEYEDDKGTLYKIQTGHVKYPDILHMIEHLYSQLVSTSHLNTQQLIVVLMDVYLKIEMMDVKYIALHDEEATSFLQDMNIFIEIMLMGGAHEGMKAKHVASLMGAYKQVTVSDGEKKKGIFGRFG